MNLFKKHKLKAQTTDKSLVMYSLGGDREAFCQIVDRYQNLLCSVAYSSVGQIQLSEDLAQETFIEAWKSLANLEDPKKLKAWLCGILRFKINAQYRKSSKQPSDIADHYSEENEVADHTADLEQKHITQQQQDLMWQVLSEIDEVYREPLVMYYRHQQSIDKVASELDLSTDNVKQRLSRGRKLLKEAMSQFVEDGLKSTTPSLVFTVAVMSAISGLAPSAKAATLTGAAIKSTSIIKLSTVATLLAVFSGFISSFFGLKAALDQSRTKRERRFAFQVVFGFMALAAFFVLGTLGLKHWAISAQYAALTTTVLANVLMFAYIVANVVLVFYMFKTMSTMRAREIIFEPSAFENEQDQPNSKRREFRSKQTLLGVPLFHFQFGMPTHKEKPAFAWVAGGAKAYGLLIAWGGIAVAPFSVGILSVGIFTIGTVGLGLFATGAAAIGGLSFGASAIGYKAYASLTALGWQSAFSNGFSVAKEAAIGPISYAAQVNNNIASEMSNLHILNNVYSWLLIIIAIVVIAPSALYAKKVKQRMRVK